MRATNRVREFRVRVSESDYRLLSDRARQMELPVPTYARSLMLRLLRFEQTPEQRNGEGAA